MQSLINTLKIIPLPDLDNYNIINIIDVENILKMKLIKNYEDLNLNIIF